MLQRISCTNKHCTLLYYNTNIDVANYNRILFSDMKLSKKFCVHRIEHEPVLLTVEEHYSFMSVHQIHKLLKM